MRASAAGRPAPSWKWRRLLGVLVFACLSISCGWVGGLAWEVRLNPDLSGTFVLGIAKRPELTPVDLEQMIQERRLKSPAWIRSYEVRELAEGLEFRGEFARLEEFLPGVQIQREGWREVRLRFAREVADWPALPGPEWEGTVRVFVPGEVLSPEPDSPSSAGEVTFKLGARFEVVYQEPLPGWMQATLLGLGALSLVLLACHIVRRWQQWDGT